MKRTMILALSVALLVSLTETIRRADANASPQLLTGILAKMEKMHKDLRSLKAGFVQEKVNAQIGTKDKDYGTLLYKPGVGKAKGKFRLDYTKPSNNTVAVNGDSFLFYQPKLNQAFKKSVTEAAKGRVGGYGQLIGLDSSVKTLVSQYDIDVIGDANVDGQNATHLRFTPKTRGGLTNIEMWINNSGFPLMQKFNERNGDYTVFKLTNPQQNVAINDGDFDVKLPGGVKIVDKM
jgi:outer membrane lipoprotein-sorting protein